MNMIKLSVIVPIYNASEYLEKCVDSILNQTEKQIELILVDDGSTDDSGTICDAYGRQDSRVRVIHQKNAGVSVARNAGLQEATGEYIGFVDSDDWILDNMYEELLEKARKTQAQIVMCDAVTVYSDGKKKVDTINQLMQAGTLLKNELNPQLLVEMAGSTCRCIYCRKMIRENHIEFPVGIKFSEDRIFNIYAMGYAKKIHYTKQALYMRYINVDSAVHRFHADYFQLVKNALDGTKKAVGDVWGNGELYQIAYLHQFINGCVSAINNYFYKTSTFSIRQKFAAVNVICNDIEVRDAIIKSGAKGLWARAIQNKRFLLLCTYAKISNLKYKR